MLGAIKIKSVLMISLIIILSSCSTQKMFSITPEEQDLEYDQGYQIAVFEDSLYASTINFEAQYGAQLVFFTYFENNSDEIISVDPGKFHFHLYKNSNQLDSTNLLIKRTAFDPELQINVMNKHLNENEDEKAALTFLNCLVGTASVVLAVADDDDDEDCDDSYTVIDAIGGTVANQITIEESYEMEKADLLVKREFWKNEVLRKTTLYPGEKVGGLVHFPLHEDIGWLRISLPIGESIHKYKFRQDIIK